MKQKNLISLTIAFAFLAMSITGVLMYIKQKAHPVEITHTIFGLLFVGFAIFHIINNWSSITGYSKERRSGKIQKELLVAGGIFGVLLIGGLTEILEPVAEAGRIFAGKRPPRQEKLSFDEVSTNKDEKGTALNIMLQKGKEVEFPVLAVWVEDSARNFVENLFVPAKVAQLPKNEEEAREAKFEGKVQSTAFSADALAAWNAKSKSKAPNFERFTPNENFVLKTNTTAKGRFFVVAEMKSKDKTEVYEAPIDLSKSEVSKLKGKDNSLIINGIVEIK